MQRTRIALGVSMAMALLAGSLYGRDDRNSTEEETRQTASSVALCEGARASGNRRVSGVIKWHDGTRLAGAKVRAWDSDIGPDDPMGSDITNTCGEYTIHYADGHWDPAPHRITTWRPDIYITVALQEHGEWLRAKESEKSNNHPLRDHLTKNATVNPLPVIFGIVRKAEDNTAVSGLKVKAYDSDVGRDDKMGEAMTDKNGRYEIRYARKDWDWGAGVRPDVYVEAFRDGVKVALAGVERNWHINEPLELNLTIEKKGETSTSSAQTCSGKAPLASASAFAFVLQEMQYGCLARDAGHVFVASEWANDRDEAESCALGAVGDPNGELTEAHDLSATTERYYTIMDYSRCPLGSPTQGPYCEYRSEPTVSASTGLSCVASDFRLSEHDIRIIDVTSRVKNATGGIDYGKWNQTCPTECKP